MSACKTTVGSGRSSYCWIAKDAYSYLRCGGNSDCSSAANSWGNCKFGSCAFDRAPDPNKEYKKTCNYKNAQMTRNLQNECSARGNSFDSWVKRHETARDIYKKFQPCTGQLIENVANKVIKFCYCYNFCGLGQTNNGCEVNGLDGRINLDANLFNGHSSRYLHFTSTSNSLPFFAGFIHYFFFYLL